MSQATPSGVRVDRFICPPDFVMAELLKFSGKSRLAVMTFLLREARGRYRIPHPTIAEMAKGTGFSNRTIEFALADFRRLGWIRKDRHELVFAWQRAKSGEEPTGDPSDTPETSAPETTAEAPLEAQPANAPRGESRRKSRHNSWLRLGRLSGATSYCASSY